MSDFLTNLKRIGLQNLIPQKPIPRRLYHYTSKTSFINILQTNVIRASNVRSANDYKELIHTDEIIREVVTRLRGRLAPITKSLFDEYENEGNIFSPGRDVFAFCLSENGDQLSQWRAYADGKLDMQSDSPVKRFAPFNLYLLQRVGPFTRSYTACQINTTF